MKTLTPDQRIEGFTELVDENENAHLTSFLAGVAHAEKVLASQEQDDEPVAWMDAQQPWDLYKNDPNPQIDAVPLFLRPAPRKPFVRLSDDEIAGAWSRCKGDFLARLNPFARAVETALMEKNNV